MFICNVIIIYILHCYPYSFYINIKIYIFLTGLEKGGLSPFSNNFSLTANFATSFNNTFANANN